MITLNLLKQKKALFNTLLLFLSFTIAAQETTSNTEISGVTAVSAFDEEVTDTKNNVKERIVDNDDDTDWAGNLGNATSEASLIFNLGATYNLAEIQYLTLAKDDPYGFQLLVSSDGTNYTDVYGGAKQQSNIDGTYKQFILPSVQNSITHVKLICYGRINATTEANTSAWNTISELRFYQEGAVASVEEKELNLTQLYPIPTNNQLQINDVSNKVSKVEIYNLLGKKIISKKITNTVQTINTSELSEGIYLVKLSNENNISTTKKIIIQH
ncbi:T9SS type A sorting domain-containing protein [Polaribacter vadi]|uniref:T9SS type A sorting domain-containing protein n=1 Tax=Polaribacter TaxID=52959 RepID=UPI001C099E32|nr:MULTISPECIES: T9SS type A sorting domain-containing protein [Polaribacter]MBU3009817.1 T9SS type A sorting domain-containing protein [Polaribacter vadi]MDO6739622.1 T9SS type A sorting domain-containing protein [Polaribacter sp. 1_MG-2023]